MRERKVKKIERKLMGLTCLETEKSEGKLRFRGVSSKQKGYGLGWLLLSLCFYHQSWEKITEEDMLEKNFTTFHASNVLLQQQYRERRFTKYSELISCLLVAEQNNELLMRNHQSRSIGSKPFPWSECNIVSALSHSLVVIESADLLPLLKARKWQ